MADYKLLVKFPTRGRPDKFFTVLDRYYYGAKRKELTSFLITCDHDDISMNNEAVRQRLQQNYKGMTVVFGHSKSKIEAVNADMTHAPEYDIILLASDDMVPEEKGYDEIIRQKMTELYPDTDGVLWFFDGYRRDFNTLCILGKKYYERFGYIYHPSYKSFWCDNEFTDVANQLGKQTFIDKTIIRHVHPDWIQRDTGAQTVYKNVHPTATNIGIDETFIKNLPFEQADARNYHQRKKEGFPR
jgi:hypothetical protein